MSLDISEDGYGGTVIKRPETGYTIVHVEPLVFDPGTPILVSFDAYQKNTQLTAEETRSLIAALELALRVLEGE
jgi:hypothetical protein